ncbi:MAG: glycosyl hydrolase family 57 [Leptolyngbyaceae cyanobacterium]
MVATAADSIMGRLPELIDDMPPLAGWEDRVQAATTGAAPLYWDRTNLRLSEMTAGFAIALHMHQPTIPAGGEGQLISNLQHMFEHPYDGDNHNAGPFAYCYARMGDFIPELVEQGCNPRVMLDYSGTLLWGFQQMQRHDILDKLRRITCGAQYYPYVEWLGTFWGHAVAPSTPIPDVKLHIRAWQHHFAALFGWEALSRVRGFSPPEMHLPNHPDTLYNFVKALKDCGYQWLLVQEHTVETLAGHGIQQPHLPHRLVAKNSQGETVDITVLIKTQGSDTKLVGQMQPFAEAKTLSPQPLGNHSVPPLVTQISDGENGGVMMNEFPGMFKRCWHEMRQRDDSVGTVGCLGTEYLELIAAAGVTKEYFPSCQAVGQHRLWQAVGDRPTAGSVQTAIADIQAEDDGFQMEGSSWTSDRSWVEGYGNVMQPMEQLSARFHQAIAEDRFPDRRAANYHRALLHTLLLETSCFRYWGQGAWTEYAQTIYRRGLATLTNN